MNQFYNRSPSVGAFADFAIVEHFCHQKHKHGPHLLTFSVNDVMGNPIEQCHFTGHRELELLLEKFHFKSYGLFYLLYDFHRKTKDTISNETITNIILTCYGFLFYSLIQILKY